MDTKAVTVTLTHDVAWHLALLLNRIDLEDPFEWAKDEAEADAIRSAVASAQSALAEAGVAAR